jgi:hypothetical protein
MLKKEIPNGVIIYEGPSLIDNAPIVVIANSFKNNKNRKIGDMVQTYILRSDIHPNDALKTGNDYSVCGNCIHRGDYIKEKDIMTNRTCYVNLLKQGIYSVYNAYKRGSYPVFSSKYAFLFKDNHLRIGSYGDPAAVPIHVWEKISSICKDYTGYTHMWSTCSNEYKNFCMASCETLYDAKKAQDLGYRTFRVVMSHSEKTLNEIPCLSQSHGVHCDICGFCDGCSKNKKNVTAEFHGATGREKQYRKKIGA